MCLYMCLCVDGCVCVCSFADLTAIRRRRRRRYSWSRETLRPFTYIYIEREGEGLEKNIIRYRERANLYKSFLQPTYIHSHLARRLHIPFLFGTVPRSLWLIRKCTRILCSLTNIRQDIDNLPNKKLLK